MTAETHGERVGARRDRECAAYGCVPGRAPASCSGPLPLELRAPRCERCGNAVGPTWELKVQTFVTQSGELDAWVGIYADGHAEGLHVRIPVTAQPSGALTRESDKEARAVLDGGYALDGRESMAWHLTRFRAELS